MSKKYDEQTTLAISQAMETAKNYAELKAVAEKLATTIPYSAKEILAKYRHICKSNGIEPIKAPEYTRKTGEPVQKKQEIVGQVAAIIGHPVESLESATRADLVILRDFLVSVAKK